MDKAKQRLLNISGLLFKLSYLPLFLTIVSNYNWLVLTNTTSRGIAWVPIITGFWGILFSDMLMLRFGDARLHISPATRLVDVGLYARNRHPSFWFFSIYQFGILLLYTGFSATILLIWLSLNIINILFLLFVQEPQLHRSIGSQYTEYQRSTPFMFWKFKIPENRMVKFLPQLVWIMGMIILRYWYRIKVTGTENIPHQRPFIVVANHESYLDPFLFSIFLPFEVQFVTTADVFTTPLMRFLLKGIGTFPMRRHRQDLKSIRTMIRLVKSGQIVGIFPEGGRSIDGSPLPILKETLKLIQHSRVPILPVHLDGAYEIWPRWASNLRRGKVAATFNPIIPVEAQANLDELEHHIRHSIFTNEKVFSPVKTGSIARGLDNFLWACNKCQAHNSIVVHSPNSIRCTACDSQWQVEDNYLLVDEDSKQSSTLISWMSDIKQTMLAHQPELSPGLDFPAGEHLYLQSCLNKYVSEDGSEMTEDLHLILGTQHMFLADNSTLIKTWPMEKITIFTMDYHNAASIGVGGIRHTFYLPEDEITLKWQMYFDRVYADFKQLT